MLPILFTLCGSLQILRLRFGVPEDAQRFFAFGGIFLSGPVEIIVPSIEAFQQVSAELIRKDVDLRVWAL
jgi:hypothetical protein